MAAKFFASSYTAMVTQSAVISSCPSHRADAKQQSPLLLIILSYRPLVSICFTPLLYNTPHFEFRLVHTRHCKHHHAFAMSLHLSRPLHGVKTQCMQKASRPLHGVKTQCMQKARLVDEVWIGLLSRPDTHGALKHPGTAEAGIIGIHGRKRVLVQRISLHVSAFSLKPVCRECIAAGAACVWLLAQTEAVSLVTCGNQPGRRMGCLISRRSVTKRVFVQCISLHVLASSADRPQ